MAKTMHLPLPDAVTGERRELAGRLRKLSYYVAGPARIRRTSAALIHSVNAAGSAYEVRPLHERYRTLRTVYSLDLPGYGFSDRSDRDYTVRLMTDAILAMTDEIARRHGSVPVDALALSLSSEFLARAAAEVPGRFRTVALVSPTGFDRRAPWNGPAGSNRGRQWLYDTFTVGSGAGLLRLPHVSPQRALLSGEDLGGKNIDQGLLEYDLLTTRDPGAHHVVYRFVSGFLFSADITHVYESLTMPVWMSHGVRGDFTDYRHALAFSTRSNWSFDVFEAGALPHFEVQADFMARYDAFLARSAR